MAQIANKHQNYDVIIWTRQYNWFSKLFQRTAHLISCMWHITPKSCFIYAAPSSWYTPDSFVVADHYSLRKGKTWVLRYDSWKVLISNVYQFRLGQRGRGYTRLGWMRMCYLEMITNKQHQSTCHSYSSSNQVYCFEIPTI